MQLLEAALGEYHRRGVWLPPDRAFYRCQSRQGQRSSRWASARILERQPGFPRDLLGRGHRRLLRRPRRVPHPLHRRCPIALVDFLSNYATVCCLNGAWRLLHPPARRHHRGRPSRYRAVARPASRLTSFTIPATWRASKRPLLGRAGTTRTSCPSAAATTAAGHSDSIAVTPVMLSEPVPCMLADLAASKLLQRPPRKPARIVRAVALPAGRREAVDGLRPLRIPGAGMVDPRTATTTSSASSSSAPRRRPTPTSTSTTRDWVRQIAQDHRQRHRLRHQRRDEPPPPHQARSASRSTASNTSPPRPPRPKYPGEYCFPPLAAMITAGARLLLAMLEAEVTQARRQLRLLRHRQHGHASLPKARRTHPLRRRPRNR